MWTKIRAIAHRCGGNLAPENSLAGLRAAAAAGFRAVEFDVMLSADGTPWLIHDETLERTTDGAGEVSATHDEVLARLHCGKGWAGAMAAEPLSRLDDALVLCAGLGLCANIEIKPAPGFERATGRVVGAAVAAWIDDARRRGVTLPSPLLSSFSKAGLQAAAECAPLVARAWLVDEVPRDWQAQIAAVGATALHCAAAQPDPERLTAIVATGIPLRCYTVNDPVEARRLYAIGITAIFSDDLAGIAAAGLLADELPDNFRP